MQHKQQRHERHERDRKKKQAHERQMEARFSAPGRGVRPFWFLTVGFALTVIVLGIWIYI